MESLLLGRDDANVIQHGSGDSECEDRLSRGAGGLNPPLSSSDLAV